MDLSMPNAGDTTVVGVSVILQGSASHSIADAAADVFQEELDINDLENRPQSQPFKAEADQLCKLLEDDKHPTQVESCLVRDKNGQFVMALFSEHKDDKGVLVEDRIPVCKISCIIVYQLTYHK